MNELSACACLGPAGDCPCIRRSKGLKVEITETYISAELFAELPDEDKQTINDLKDKAFWLWHSKQREPGPRVEAEPTAIAK